LEPKKKKALSFLSTGPKKGTELVIDRRPEIKKKKQEEQKKGTTFLTPSYLGKKRRPQGLMKRQ